jgi:hypothetical protein
MFDAALMAIGDLHQFKDHSRIVFDAIKPSAGSPDFLQAKPKVFTR